MIKFLIIMSCFLSANAAKFAQNAESVKPLLVGSEIPSVKLSKIDGFEINIKDLVKNKPSIVVFYRGGWCPYCNVHLSELRKIEKDMKAAGVQLLAISTDRPEELKKSIEKNKIEYQLYSDSKMNVAKAFGIAFKVDDQTVKKYKNYKIDLEAVSGEKHHLLPVPAVFALNKDSIIEFSHVNPNYKVRLSSNILTAVVQELSKK